MNNNSCDYNLKYLKKIGHTLVIWSHVFYIIAAIFAFYKKFYFLGTMLIIESIVSITHHLNANEKIWALSDSILANILFIQIFIYAFHNMYKQKININMIAIILVAILTLPTFFMAILATKNVSPGDNETAPPNVFYNQNPTSYPTIIRKQITYQLYHSIWHMMGGILSLFIIINIQKTPVNNL